MEVSRLYTSLALAGTLPFVACAILPLAGVETIPLLGSLNAVASSYGMAIVCFVAGAHWGTYLAGQAGRRFNLFVTSNAIFLAVWFAFIGASVNWAIATQIVAFLLLLFIDYRLREDGVISEHYFEIRSIATLVAVISLLMILLFQ